MTFQYPLSMSFKLIALAPQIYVHDAAGQEIIYVRQKVLNLKEDVRIYSDQSRSEEVFRINADRIIDWSANYHFTDSKTESSLGRIKRKGWRSIWRSTYLVFDEHEQQTYFIREDNAWTKVGDALLGEIPFLGFISGYVLHPTYTAYKGVDRDDLRHPVMRLKKEPAFWEGVFSIHGLDESLTVQEEKRLLLSFFMMIQLERRRG